MQLGTKTILKQYHNSCYIKCTSKNMHRPAASI